MMAISQKLSPKKLLAPVLQCPSKHEIPGVVLEVSWKHVRNRWGCRWSALQLNVTAAPKMAELRETPFFFRPSDLVSTDPLF